MVSSLCNFGRSLSLRPEAKRCHWTFAAIPTTLGEDSEPDARHSVAGDRRHADEFDELPGVTGLMRPHDDENLD